MFFFNPYQGRFSIPKNFVDSTLPPMIYIPNTHIEVDTVPFGCCIAAVTIMMFGLLRKTKRKMMVAEAFVLFSLLHMNSMLADRPLLWSEIEFWTNPDEKTFDSVIFVSWSLDAVPLFPYVHLTELAENKAQHKQWSFPAIFPILILSVEPSHVHIICTP